MAPWQWSHSFDDRPSTDPTWQIKAKGPIQMQRHLTSCMEVVSNLKHPVFFPAGSFQKTPNQQPVWDPQIKILQALRVTPGHPLSLSVACPATRTDGQPIHPSRWSDLFASPHAQRTGSFCWLMWAVLLSWGFSLHSGSGFHESVETPPLWLNKKCHCIACLFSIPSSKQWHLRSSCSLIACPEKQKESIVSSISQFLVVMWIETRWKSQVSHPIHVCIKVSYAFISNAVVDIIQHRLLRTELCLNLGFHLYLTWNSCIRKKQHIPTTTRIPVRQIVNCLRAIHDSESEALKHHW